MKLIRREDYPAWFISLKSHALGLKMWNDINPDNYAANCEIERPKMPSYTSIEARLAEEDELRYQEALQKYENLTPAEQLDTDRPLKPAPSSDDRIRLIYECEFMAWEWEEQKRTWMYNFIRSTVNPQLMSTVCMICAHRERMEPRDMVYEIKQLWGASDWQMELYNKQMKEQSEQLRAGMLR